MGTSPKESAMSEPTRTMHLSAAQRRRLLDLILIRFRGGLPRLRGRSPRSTQWLAREVCWQAARYAELLAWYPCVASSTSGQKASAEMRDFDLLQAPCRGS